MKAKMNNIRFWTSSTDERYLNTIATDTLIKSGFDIRNHCEEHFQPYGYTSLFLLSESHFAIHTFPEEGRTYCELSSCVDNPYYNFIHMLNKFKDVQIIKEADVDERDTETPAGI